MWITCNVCMGEGIIHTIHKIYDKKIYKKICHVCNPENGYSEEHIFYYKGQIWVEDNYEPISPPSSPR